MNQTTKRLVGTIIVLLPVLFLVSVWVMMTPLSARFTDLQTSLLSLGRISGLIGLALYSISLVLHVRITFLKKLLLDGAYICKLHHNLGSWALVLLLIHPIALALRFALNDLYYAAKFLVPTDNLVNLAGFLALMIMIAAMLVTFYLKKNHKLWLWVHRSMLIAYLGSFLHLLFVINDTSSNPLLKYYLLSLMLAGILAFSYQRLSRYSSKAGSTAEVCE